MKTQIGFVVRDHHGSLWLNGTKLFATVEDAAKFAKKCNFSAWDMPPVFGINDTARLVELANMYDLKVWQLAGALDIKLDRLNNGGLPELIGLALEDDDPEFIEQAIFELAGDTE